MGVLLDPSHTQDEPLEDASVDLRQPSQETIQRRPKRFARLYNNNNNNRERVLDFLRFRSIECSKKQKHIHVCINVCINKRWKVTFAEASLFKEDIIEFKGEQRVRHLPDERLQEVSHHTLVFYCAQVYPLPIVHRVSV